MSQVRASRLPRSPRSHQRPRRIPTRGPRQGHSRPAAHGDQPPDASPDLVCVIRVSWALTWTPSRTVVLADAPRRLSAGIGAGIRAGPHRGVRGHDAGGGKAEAAGAGAPSARGGARGALPARRCPRRSPSLPTRRRRAPRMADARLISARRAAEAGGAPGRSGRLCPGGELDTPGARPPSARRPRTPAVPWRRDADRRGDDHHERS